MSECDLQKTLVAKQEAQSALLFLQNESDTLLVTAHRTPNPDNLGSLQDRESPEQAANTLFYLPVILSLIAGQCVGLHIKASPHTL